MSGDDYKDFAEMMDNLRNYGKDSDSDEEPEMTWWRWLFGFDLDLLSEKEEPYGNYGTFGFDMPKLLGDRTHIGVAWIVIALAIAIAGFSIGVWAVESTVGVTASTGLLSSDTAKTVGALAIFIFGVLLFFLKKHIQVLYGILELAFALVMCWNAVGKLAELGVAGWTIIVTSAYLVVRGLVNIDEGTNRPKPKVESPRDSEDPKKPLVPDGLEASL